MITPLPGYVLLEPMDEPTTTTSSGLVMPESMKEKPAMGKVLNIGASKANTYRFDGAFLDIPVIKGDTVWFKRWGGQDIKFEGKDYKLVPIQDLMGVIDG